MKWFYALLRPLLFALPPEVAHAVALRGLWLANAILSAARRACHFEKSRHPERNEGSPRIDEILRSAQDDRTLLKSCTFPNLIGLAAGLDKNAEYIDALATLGFGHIEVGTVTPKPQPGNPKPRLFRLISQEALINRMGFNNKGVDYMITQLKKTRYRGVLGINIGKNKTTPLENAVDDYVFCFKALWSFSSYITVNISSPNTPLLRDLQKSDFLRQLLVALKKEQTLVLNDHQRYVPLVVKISPDLSQEELQNCADILLEQKIDGVIATNTTISREGVEGLSEASEEGGLSGKPLSSKSTAIIHTLHQRLKDEIQIIGCGGISSTESAREKLTAGATLLQVYTGFLYHGPALIKQLSHL